MSPKESQTLVPAAQQPINEEDLTDEIALLVAEGRLRYCRGPESEIMTDDEGNGYLIVTPLGERDL